MFIKRFLISLLFVYSSTSSAIVNKIKLDNNVYLSIENQTVEYYPYSLNMKTEEETIKVDQYPEEGGKPVFNGMAVIKSEDKSVILVQFYWKVKHADIDGLEYQTYSYRYDGNNVFINENLNKEKALSGFKGCYYDIDGLCEDSLYSYGTIDKIKQYIKGLYL
ncbi:hypothetical protein A9266_24435 [Vibrio tasmaniensis]|nr:hypothetical protein A9266_24435 [Vibrio tasmaniensis]